jgi:tetratricopeptide (TPR) repeat protein
MAAAFPVYGELSERSTALQVLAERGLCQEAVHSFSDGMQLFQSGDAKSAIEAFSKVTELAPTFAGGHVFLGLANALSYNIYSAIDSLERAGEVEPESFAAHYTLAQLNFKLRIPQKGYEAAERALHCIQNLEQRKMLTQLLREERARERSGIARPWFNKPFGKPFVWIAGSGLAAMLIALIIHVA